MSMDLITKAHNEGISILKLLAHKTDALQPLDKCCFTSLKAQWDKRLVGVQHIPGATKMGKTATERKREQRERLKATEKYQIFKENESRKQKDRHIQKKSKITIEEKEASRAKKRDEKILSNESFSNISKDRRCMF
ncbi:hypothetical protein AVEN_47311-1 [Araneus ventricosus]|uniref:Uncharacterized protein n=1 Tax=Araneus ventricosus TaxID=182803 RepID=A0A4Y2UA20_ARAVE|nr:hypothetical protein AVEN_47311-1 [Araneus ventricosus]